MSAFVAPTSGIQLTGWNETRLNHMDFQPESIFVDVFSVAPGSFNSKWWPGGGLVGDIVSDSGILSSFLWGWFHQAAGAASRFGFVGVTRDSNGSPVSAVTVKLFLTLNDSLQDTSVSDDNGRFLLNTVYYPNQHYIVAHKSGSPDLDGVTVNNLVGV